MAQHTAACLAATVKAEEERLKYVQENPNYCRTCRGWGIYEAGVSLPASAVSSQVTLPEHSELCSDCVDEGRCPRCGEEGIEADDGGLIICDSCGFHEEETSGLPEYPGCKCTA